MLFRSTKLEGPDRYSVNILSQELRQQITDSVMSQLTTADLSPQFRKLRDLYQQSVMFSHNEKSNRFLYEEALLALTQLDNIRLNNFKTTFAPILELLQNEFKQS